MNTLQIIQAVNYLGVQFEEFGSAYEGEFSFRVGDAALATFTVDSVTVSTAAGTIDIDDIEFMSGAGVSLIANGQTVMSWSIHDMHCQVRHGHINVSVPTNRHDSDTQRELRIESLNREISALKASLRDAGAERIRLDELV